MANTIKYFPVQAKVILKNKTKGNVIIVIYPIDYEFRLSSFNFAWSFNDMDEGFFFAVSKRFFLLSNENTYTGRYAYNFSIENYYKYKMSFSKRSYINYLFFHGRGTYI